VSSGQLPAYFDLKPGRIPSIQATAAESDEVAMPPSAPTHSKDSVEGAQLLQKDLNGLFVSMH